jgi:glycosyltransferase involved in cell wall biosynthesis
MQRDSAVQPAPEPGKSRMPQLGLRIAIDARPALWPRTGTGTIAHNILKNIGGTGQNAEYFAYFDTNPALHLSAYSSIQSRFGGPRQEFLWSNTWLPRQLRRDNIDVFVTFLDKEIPIFPTRCRVVSMIHDLIPLRFPKIAFRNIAHRLYYEGLIRAAARRSDVILTNSQFSRREIVSGLGIPEAKIHKITLGVETPPVIDPAHTQAVLARYRLARPYAIALGSTEPRKNNARVIEAMRRLSLAHPRLRLAIAGSPWRGVAFDRSLIDARVCLLGHVPDEDLPALMSAAEMLVFPSLHEGFGLPVVEAMALGVPVVTSNVTALPEVAGDAAFYADPTSIADIAAQMNRILTDRQLAVRLRDKGRERARLFRWETACREITSLCEVLMESSQWNRQTVTP